MIPHRMLTSEVYGNGLKDRVLACRKRVRLNRTTHRAIGNISVNEVETSFPETTPSVSPVSEFKDHAGNLPESRSMLLAGEQGVGIT